MTFRSGVELRWKDFMEKRYAGELIASEIQTK